MPVESYVDELEYITGLTGEDNLLKSKYCLHYFNEFYKDAPIQRYSGRGN